jgi:hypothetical protein
MHTVCNLHGMIWLDLSLKPPLVSLITFVGAPKVTTMPPQILVGPRKVKGENGKEVMEVELPTAWEDVDQLWVASHAVLKMKLLKRRSNRMCR